MKDRIAPKKLTLTLDSSSEFLEANEAEGDLVTESSSSEVLEDSLDSGESNEPIEGTENYFEFQVAFSPPLYRQRYVKVCEILKDPRWVKAMSRVVEFGCKYSMLWISIYEDKQVKSFRC